MSPIHFLELYQLETVAEQIAEVRGLSQYRISESRGFGGHKPPEAASNLCLMVPQTSPDLSISTITQSYLTIST